jgi:predicted secreted protein
MNKKESSLYTFFCVIISLLLGCSAMQEQNTATIELEANATTGYTWVYTMSPGNVIREVSSNYIPDENPEGKDGVGGKQVFTFEAITKGEAELVFSYLREWETGIPPLKIKTYRAIVDDKNNLVLEEN